MIELRLFPDNVEQKKSDRTHNKSILGRTFPEMFSMETLPEKMKAIGLESCEFDNRQKRILPGPSHKFSFAALNAKGHH